MELVIDLDEKIYNNINWFIDVQTNDTSNIAMAIKNGTPLEKHDEEVIKETVESIWGKPPYTELLDKIWAEIEKAIWEDVVVSLDGTDETKIPRLDPDDVFEIIDKYRKEPE